MKKIVKKLTGYASRKTAKKTDQNTTPPDWFTVLVGQPGITVDAKTRTKMTVSCKDTDYIPKVKGAGSIKKIDGKDYQLMHNGLLVELGGYFGDWMADIIKQLKGHHEPQEEKVFHEILKRIPRGGTMIELGSYWSYYSLWFNKVISDATNYCCEPDPKNLELGKRNAAVNQAKDIYFLEAAAGKDHGVVVQFKPQEDDRPPVSVPIQSVDGLVKDHSIDGVDMLHMDVQGVELDALKGAEKTIKAGAVRFVFVSTHHYFISRDPYLHEKCLDYIRSLGGHIIVEHAIHESFSGDGLIVASFDEQDKDLTLTVSENRMSSSMFRSYTKDIELLTGAMEAYAAAVKNEAA